MAAIQCFHAGDGGILGPRPLGGGLRSGSCGGVEVEEIGTGVGVGV